jgi:hypothetical protein
VRIDGAWEAMAAGRLDDALRLLVDAWRARRQPEVAVAIEVVSSRVVRPSIAATTGASRQEAFLARAARRDPTDVGPLLDILLDGKSGEAVQARVEALAASAYTSRAASSSGAA